MQLTCKYLKHDFIVRKHYLYFHLTGTNSILKRKTNFEFHGQNRLCPYFTGAKPTLWKFIKEVTDWSQVKTELFQVISCNIY